MSVFNYQKDQDGIVTITMDMPGPVNSMTQEYRQTMRETVSRLEAEPDLTGVVLASAKKVFFAGGNLQELLDIKSGQEQIYFDAVVYTKTDLRRLEKLPVPVVAAINGAALGGGYEICLACNYRIAYNHKSVLIGLPEVSLGLLPGGGGIVRLVNRLGLEKALPFLLEGKKLTPEKALAEDFVDELVDSIDDLVPAAKTWIKANKDNEQAAVNPWDRKGFRIPGGPVNSPTNVQLAAMAPAMLLKKTRGLLPAPEEILDVAFQASFLDFETGLMVETRALTKLVVTPEAKNMITTFFFQMNQINSGKGRPANIERTLTKKVGVLGAGMMGQGIAYVSAMAGIEVVLKDISQQAADKGKAYSDKILQKSVARGFIDDAKAKKVLALIHPTDKADDLQGCDLIIEAVFENLELKNKISSETESYLSEDGIWGSNTSTLPITLLAKASSSPEKFIGMHFFSPVDKMPLVEIICGDKTGDEALAKAYDYTRQIKKTPIIVNDSLGFFTSRTFGTYLDEGARLLTEGVDPVLIDNLGKAIGMPVGPLQVQDETSLELARKAHETWDQMGARDKWGDDSVRRRIFKDMITDNGRGGRHHGGGYYEYHEDGSKNIWPTLYDLYYDETVSTADQDIKDRLMFRQVIETLKCLETNVLRSVADANIGSIMGIGAPVHTGGFVQFVNTYGFEDFMQRCDELSETFGDRFNCPEIVKQHASSGELFS